MKANCPICKKKVEWEGNRFRPFCSERCRLVDLGRWAEGTYVFQTEEGPESEDETEDHSDV